MLNRMFLGLIGLLFVANGSLRATSQLPPSDQEYFSTDREYRFEVKAPKGIDIYDALALQRGNFLQLTHKYAERSATDFVAIGILSVLRNGRYEKIWQRVLENAVCPAVVLIEQSQQSGVHVITLNDYFLFRDTKAGIVVYDTVGRAKVKLALEQIIPQEELSRAFSKTDTANVLACYEIRDGKISFQLSRYISSVNLDTGAIDIQKRQP